MLVKVKTAREYRELCAKALNQVYWLKHNVEKQAGELRNRLD